MTSDLRKLITKRARYLRREETDAERILWRELRGRSSELPKFRRQHQVSTLAILCMALSSCGVSEVDETVIPTYENYWDGVYSKTKNCADGLGEIEIKGNNFRYTETTCEIQKISVNLDLYGTNLNLTDCKTNLGSVDGSIVTITPTTNAYYIYNWEKRGPELIYSCPIEINN